MSDYYKNWNSIRKLKDHHFMMGLAMLDLHTDLGQMIASRFPEFFSTTEKPGGAWPIPLSAIRALAEKIAGRSRQPSNDHLVIYDAIQTLGIPHCEFAINDDGIRDFQAFPMPKSIKSHAHDPVGTVFEWEGKKVVVVDNSEGCGLIELSPAECIDINK